MINNVLELHTMYYRLGKFLDFYVMKGNQKGHKYDFPEGKWNSFSHLMMTENVIKSLKNCLNHAYYWARDPMVYVVYITNL